MLTIEKLLHDFHIEKYEISDFKVDVNESVYINNEKLDKLPLNFKRVFGNFKCSENNLIDLQGCPSEVYGNFDCSDNLITSLQGCPTYVKGSFFCYNNKLTTLKFIPKKIPGTININGNPLPTEIYDNIEHINKIVEWQDEYTIWNSDNSLNSYRFYEMMYDIKAC